MKPRKIDSLIVILFSCLQIWAAPRPNVLLILVDDLKPALGCYGDPLAVTPNIDRLAARGVRFNLAFCNQSVCAPSRNNLLLGSRSTSIGIYSLNRNFRLAVPNALTLPQHFMKHGWRTEAVGKVLHTGHGNHDDFASWSGSPLHEKVVEYLIPANSADGRLTREEAYFTNQNLEDIRSLPRGSAWESADVEDRAYADGRIAEEGIRRLRQAKSDPDTPFFLALGFVKPHLPFTAPTKYWEMHDPNKFKLEGNPTDPAQAPGFAGKRGGEIVNYDPLTVENLKEEGIQRKLIHGYYAAASFADAQIGRVLDELDRLDLWGDTIVVLWGDHGWHLGDHGYWTKHTNYEQANRIPLIFAAPGVTTPGTVSNQIAETVDIYPTLSRLSDLPDPDTDQPMDGINLAPALQDPTLDNLKDHAYHCYPRGTRMGRAIRTHRYRLVEWKTPGSPDDSAEIELYDYLMDPKETRNWASKKPEIVRQMLDILKKHTEAKPSV